MLLESFGGGGLVPYLQEALPHGFLSRTTNELENWCGLAPPCFRTLEKPENYEAGDDRLESTGLCAMRKHFPILSTELTNSIPKEVQTLGSPFEMRNSKGRWEMPELRFPRQVLRFHLLSSGGYRIQCC